MTIVQVQLGAQTVPVQIFNTTLGGVRALSDAATAVDIDSRARKAANLSDLADPAAAVVNIGAVASADLADDSGAAMVGLLSAGTGAQPTTVAERFSREPLLVDEFYQSRDGSDYGLAFSRAYAAGLAQLRNLIAKSGATYTVATNINIYPNLAGWTPSLDLNGATVRLTTEAAGFRRRGLKDGAVANVASGGIVNGTIDANNITGANGVRCIFGSNSGGTVDNVDIINMSQGYGWRRFCYADGGAVVGRPIYSGNISGITDAGTSTRWYGCADDGDLSYVQPGSAIAAGQSRPLATVNSTQDSTGCANTATMRYWSNGTGSPINVPSAMTSASYVTAGLTSGATDVTVNGVSMAAAKAEVYISAQARFPRNVVRPQGAIFRNVFVTGGYYGFAIIGTDATTFDNVGSYGAVRGIACEFGATNVFARRVLITDNLSSGVLVNYGSTGADFSDVAIYGGSRWDGQALFNVQLGASGLSLTNLKTRTADNVTNGEYHVYVGPHCSGARIKGLDLRGDCIKAWVCVESAWRTTAGSAENYSANAEYAALTSAALTDIDISDVSIFVAATTSATCAAIALCQTNDTTNGEIGLSDIRVRGVSAMSPKHSAHFVIREMATATPTSTGAINCRLSDFACPTQTTYANLAADIILPRGRKHFAEVKRATNIDDDTLRSIQNLAIPSITYGNRFIANGGSNITNFEDNGSGATGQKCLTGHTVNLRGGGQTINNNGGANGIILNGAASTTPTTQQEITLRFDVANDQMLEVGRGY